MYLFYSCCYLVLLFCGVDTFMVFIQLLFSILCQKFQDIAKPVLIVVILYIIKNAFAKLYIEMNFFVNDGFRCKCHAEFNDVSFFVQSVSCSDRVD